MTTSLMIIPKHIFKTDDYHFTELTKDNPQFYMCVMVFVNFIRSYINPTSIYYQEEWTESAIEYLNSHEPYFRQRFNLFVELGSRMSALLPMGIPEDFVISGITKTDVILVTTIHERDYR